MDTLTIQYTEYQLTALVYDFFFYLDHGQYDELTAMFLVDGIFDKVGIVLNGHTMIRAAMDKRKQNVTRHFVANMRFTHQNDSDVEVAMYVANYHGQPVTQGLPVTHVKPPIIIEFIKSFQRTSSGWRISKSTARVIIND